jgi:pilus assembly protein FimV
VGARALAVVRSLPDHSLIDRLVRSRVWIPVLGVLLAGIVFMQVEILKLGTSLGRSIERTGTLQSQNESLQAGVAALADDQRIERLATGMGMVMPSPSLLTFVPARSQSQLGKALAGIHAPDPVGFASQLAAQVAAAALTAPATTAGQAPATQSTINQATNVPASSGAVSSAGSVAAASGPAATGTTAGGASATGVAPTTGATGTGASTTGATATGTGSGNAAGAAAASGAAGLPSASASQSGNPTGG